MEPLTFDSAKGTVLLGSHVNVPSRMEPNQTRMSSKTAILALVWRLMRDDFFVSGVSTDPRHVSRFLLLILFTSFQHMCVFSSYLTVRILIFYC